MPRILIFGNSGSGKSTLAKKLADKYQAAHLDLDTLAWLDTHPPKRAALEQSKQAIEIFCEQNKHWIIEGCYADLLALLKEQTGQMLFLNPGVKACIDNCHCRPWEPHKYASKQAQDANLELLINWIKDYEQRDDEFSQTAHQTLFDNFTGIKQLLQSNDEINQFFLRATKKSSKLNGTVV